MSGASLDNERTAVLAGVLAAGACVVRKAAGRFVAVRRLAVVR